MYKRQVLKIFRNVIRPSVKPPVGIEVCPVRHAYLLNGRFINAPDGYRLLKDPIEIKIIPTYTDDRNNYIKGQGATAETLKELQATAHIKSFYDGVTDEKDLQLETNPEQGNANLTVVNKVGSKLPVTGTPALAILLITGTGLMAVAMAVAKARKKE